MARTMTRIFGMVGLVLLIFSVFTTSSSGQEVAPLELVELKFDKPSATVGETVTVQAKLDAQYSIQFGQIVFDRNIEGKADYQLSYNENNGYWEVSFQVSKFMDPGIYQVIRVEFYDTQSYYLRVEHDKLPKTEIQIDTPGLYIVDIKANSTLLSPDKATLIQIDLNAYENEVVYSSINLGKISKLNWINTHSYMDKTYQMEYNPSTGFLEVNVTISKYQQPLVDIWITSISLSFTEYYRTFNFPSLESYLPDAPIFSTDNTVVIEVDYFDVNTTSATVGDTIQFYANFTNGMDGMEYIYLMVLQGLFFEPNGYDISLNKDRLYQFNLTVNEQWRNSALDKIRFEIGFQDNHWVSLEFDLAQPIEIAGTDSAKVNSVTADRDTIGEGETIKISADITNTDMVDFIEVLVFNLPLGSNEVDKSRVLVLKPHYNTESNLFEADMHYPVGMNGELIVGFVRISHITPDTSFYHDYYNAYAFDIPNIAIQTDNYQNPPGESINVLISPETGSSEINERVGFKIEIESNFSHTMLEVDLEIVITAPDKTTNVIFKENLYLAAHSTIYQDINLTFNQTGEYLIQATLYDDIGHPWEASTAWKVTGAGTEDTPNNNSSSNTPDLELPGFEFMNVMLGCTVSLVAVYRRKN